MAAIVRHATNANATCGERGDRPDAGNSDVISVDCQAKNIPSAAAPRALIIPRTRSRGRGSGAREPVPSALEARLRDAAQSGRPSASQAMPGPAFIAATAAVRVVCATRIPLARSTVSICRPPSALAVPVGLGETVARLPALCHVLPRLARLRPREPAARMRRAAVASRAPAHEGFSRCGLPMAAPAWRQATPGGRMGAIHLGAPHARAAPDPPPRLGRSGP